MKQIVATIHLQKDEDTRVVAVSTVRVEVTALVLAQPLDVVQLMRDRHTSVDWICEYVYPGYDGPFEVEVMDAIKQFFDNTPVKDIDLEAWHLERLMHPTIEVRVEQETLKRWNVRMPVTGLTRADMVKAAKHRFVEAGGGSAWTQRDQFTHYSFGTILGVESPSTKEPDDNPRTIGDDLAAQGPGNQVGGA